MIHYFFDFGCLDCERFLRWNSSGSLFRILSNMSVGRLLFLCELGLALNHLRGGYWWR